MIGINRYELYNFDACFNHTVNCVCAATTNANNLNDSEVVRAKNLLHEYLLSYVSHLY